MTAASGDVLWRPDDERILDSELTRFAAWLRETGAAEDADTSDYAPAVALVDPGPGPLLALRRRRTSASRSARPPDRSVAPEGMPGGGWFPGTTVNYAARALAGDGEAVVALDEDGTRRVTSRAELRRQVGALAAFLRARGVRHGDRVVAVLPNRIEAVVGLLAAASVGAVWSVVAPEFGAGAIASRLQQLEPVVLLAAPGYRYGGRDVDRTDVLTEVLPQLPTVRDVVWVDRPAVRLAGGPPPLVGRRRGRGPRRGRPTRCRSTTRCGSCSPPAPPACPRASCTATAASSSSTSRPWACTPTCDRTSGCSSSAAPAGSSGTCWSRGCSAVPRSSCSTAIRPSRTSTACGGSPRRRA